MKRIGKLKTRFFNLETIYEVIDKLHKKKNRWSPRIAELWAKLDSDPYTALNILDKLLNMTYTPGPFNVFYRMESGKKRQIFASDPYDLIFDGILDVALKYVFMEKRRIIHPHAYGSIKNKGYHKVRNLVVGKIRKYSGPGELYAISLDTKKYYPTIDQDVLISLLKKYIKDKWILWLAETIIKRNSSGLALGLASSNILGHLYHSLVDWEITPGYGVKNYYRFCDDMIIFSTDKYYLRGIAQALESLTTNSLHQTIKSWKIVNLSRKEFITFLGCTFNIHSIRLKKRRLIEWRMKEELKKSYNPKRIISSWCGMRGGFKTFPIEDLLYSWKIYKFPEYFTRLSLALAENHKQRILQRYYENAFK